MWGLRTTRPQPHEDSNENSKNENETLVENNIQNYGNRIQGLWTFGLCCNNENNAESRFFIVDKRY